MLTIPEIETIFFKVPELHEIHKDFYDALLPRVQDWSNQQCVGDLFQKLVCEKTLQLGRINPMTPRSPSYAIFYKDNSVSMHKK